ncbi:MCE family protein [Millisia brevis]|uniref:MCE family protein n=1 Tax=Millisia brevis TaxID=264148 RepID=UPI0008370088|nr:MCE family protein [Millisia brevis]
MKVTARQWASVALYCTIGIGCGALVVNTLSVPVRGSTDSYGVEFDDIDGLSVGNPVMISGVRVGRVDGISIRDAADGTAIALVDIEIQRDYRLPADVAAGIRYGDMLGARFLDLTGVTPDPADILEPGGIIPSERTTGPLDLTALMNGFKPLFDALDPEQTNQLTRSFVDTFSGQGGSIAQLVHTIGVVGNAVGDQQQVFTALVANLTQLLESVDRRTPELRDLLSGVAALSSAVVGSNADVTTLLDQGSATVATLAGAVARSNGDYTRTVADLRETTDTWNATTAEFERFLTTVPEFADTINRMGSYGSFLSLYLCNFTLEAGQQNANLFGTAHSEVCR